MSSELRINAIDIVPTLINFEEYLLQKGLAESTVYIYISIIKSFLFANPNLSTVDDYNKFIFKSGVQKRNKLSYDSLKHFVKFYFSKDGKLASSITRNLLVTKTLDAKKLNKFYDDDTRANVIQLMQKYKHRLIAKIQDATGVRAGDVLRLKRGAISYEAYNNKKVVMRIDFVGKGRKPFVKWIFDPNLQTQIDLFIKSNLLNEEYYFIEKYDTTKTAYRNITKNYDNYLADLKQALDVYGLDIKNWATHDFRRNFARKVWDKTKDPVVLKEMLNHSNFETTIRYLRGTGLQSRDVYYELELEREKNEDE